MFGEFGAAPPAAILTTGAYSDAGSSAGGPGDEPPSPPPQAKPTRLPREGPSPGGGRMKVHERSLFELTQKMNSSSNEQQPESPVAAGSSRAARRPSVVSSKSVGGLTMGRGRSQSEIRSVASKSGDNFNKGDAGPTSPSLSEGERPRYRPVLKTDQEERKYAELMSKWQRNENAREQGDKVQMHRLKANRALREDRFERLLNSVLGSNSLAHQSAQEIQERIDTERRRCKERHRDWEEKIYNPLAAQAHQHMNPQNRGAIQKIIGSKSVDFQLPDESFRLVALHSEDPVKRELMDNAREKAFMQAAGQVLRGSRSAPELHQYDGSDLVQGLPRSRTRTTTNPVIWGQVKIHGTPAGHFSQVCAAGVGFRRGRRGGADIFLPDESDDIRCAGTRKSRLTGYHDKGILHGDKANQGECAEAKRGCGHGSAAPLQDHFSFAVGKEAVNLEFPPGKRTFNTELFH